MTQGGNRLYTYCNIYLFFTHDGKDEVAEWLRRWTANPLGSPRVGSNPILVDFFSLPFFRFSPFMFSTNVNVIQFLNLDTDILSSDS